MQEIPVRTCISCISQSHRWLLQNHTTARSHVNRIFNTSKKGTSWRAPGRATHLDVAVVVCLGCKIAAECCVCCMQKSKGTCGFDYSPHNCSLWCSGILPEDAYGQKNCWTMKHDKWEKSRHQKQREESTQTTSLPIHFENKSICLRGQMNFVIHVTSYHMLSIPLLPHVNLQ